MRRCWWETARQLPEFGLQELANSLMAAVQLGQAPPARGMPTAWHCCGRGCWGRCTALGTALPAFAQLESLYVRRHDEGAR